MWNTSSSGKTELTSWNGQFVEGTPPPQQGAPILLLCLMIFFTRFADEYVNLISPDRP